MLKQRSGGIKSVAQVFSDAILPNEGSVGIKSFWNKDDWEYRPGPMYTSLDTRMARVILILTTTKGSF